MKKFLSTLLMVVFIFIIGTPINAAYQGWHLVDSGGHLDYDGNSKYMNIVDSAVDVWENYNRGVIRKDSPFRVQDVFCYDYYEENNTFATTYSSGYIRFNKYNYDKMTSTQKKATTIHEFGHCLGLGHTKGNRDIMRQGLKNYTSLSYTDKKSYNQCKKIWGK